MKTLSPEVKQFFVPGSILLAGAMVSMAILFVFGGGSQVNAVNDKPLELSIRPVDENDHVMGPKDAKISVIEYLDYRCHFCAQFHPTMQQVLDESNDVRWVVRDFAIFGDDPAIASECVAKLSGEEKFWDFSKALFQNQKEIGRELYEKLAVEYGISEKDFSECLLLGSIEQNVQLESTEAQNAGARGTPFTVVVNETTDEWQVIPGALPYNRVISVINDVRT